MENEFNYTPPQYNSFAELEIIRRLKFLMGLGIPLSEIDPVQSCIIRRKGEISSASSRSIGQGLPEGTDPADAQLS